MDIGGAPCPFAPLSQSGTGEGGLRGLCFITSSSRLISLQKLLTNKAAPVHEGGFGGGRGQMDGWLAP